MTADALDTSKYLKDWDATERSALLRRALFDPATYGRVRFHHRSVQEYLAAYRLKRLKEKGLLEKADDAYVHNVAINSRGGGTIELSGFTSV